MIEDIETANEQNPGGAPISVSHLREHARAGARSWEVTRQRGRSSEFLARVEAARSSLDELYGELNEMPRPDYSKITGPDPILMLRENPRLLRTVVLEAASLKRTMPRLPRIVANGAGAAPNPKELHQELPRGAAIASAFFEATHSVWHPDAFKVYIEQLQLDDPLDLAELWALPAFLKFHLLDEILVRARSILDDPQAADAAAKDLLLARIQTLRETGFADRVSLLEPLIVFDALLRQDPANAYATMDFETREMYRKRVAEYGRRSDASEVQVAAAALELAREARKVKSTNPRIDQRRSHVGYYLIDNGFPQLATRIGYRPGLLDRLRTFLRNNADDFYIVGIEVVTILLMAAIIAPLVVWYPVIGGLTVAFFLLLLPAAQGTVDLFNNIVTALFKAEPLPKLDFGGGIPSEFTSLVAVPTLLMNEKQLREMVERLEVHFLANPDPNLHFCLLTDLPDSITSPRDKRHKPAGRSGGETHRRAQRQV